MTPASKSVAKKGPKPATSNKALMLQLLDGTELAFPDDMRAFFTPKQISLLMQPTPKQYIKQRQGKGGQQFSYVPIAYVLERANLIFSYGWSSHVQSHEIIAWKGNPFEVVVVGWVEVTCKDGSTLRRSTAGGMLIEYKKDQQKNLIEPLEISSAFKGAVSDMTTKAFSGFGMFLDIYDKDGLVAAERTSAGAEAGEQGQATGTTVEAAATYVDGQPVKNKASFLRQAALMGYDKDAITALLPGKLKPYTEEHHDEALAVLQAEYDKTHPKES